MIKVTVYHNVAENHSTGYTPGDPLVRVFEYRSATPSDHDPAVFAEEAFRLTNAAREFLTDSEQELAADYRSRCLRSLSVGDVVTVAFPGDAASGYAHVYACAPAGWDTPQQLPADLGEVRRASHGTTPLGWSATDTLRDEALRLLSAAWQAAHPPVDGDSRSPLEVLDSGVITPEEFSEFFAPQ